MKIPSSSSLPVIALITLFSFPASGSAQSILLSASSFTLLGGSAITNTGATVITGNVGLSPTTEAAITGVPPAVIIGGSIIDTGNITAQARLDFIKAAAGLAAMPSSEDLSGEDLGDLTLLPGVYTFDAAAQLTGTLTLDANGENNAFWVFQIGSALTTAVNSSVTVTNLGSNGGSDDGIFWVAGTSITIDTNNTIMGNYLANTSITLDTGSQGNGRALALAAISLDTNVISDIVSSQTGPGSNDWTGGLMYDPNGFVVPVPEPAAFVWLAPLSTLGLALWRRSRLAN
jgi:hypothetical protein